MPVCRPRVNPERPRPSAALAVHRCVVHRNVAGRFANAPVAFVPDWLLHVTYVHGNKCFFTLPMLNYTLSDM
jgi:hypothetical protein